MAPTKSRAAPTKATTNIPLVTRKPTTKRTQIVLGENVEAITLRGKRKADNSPLRNDKVKRSALGNLTNNVHTMQIDDGATKLCKPGDKAAAKKETGNANVKSNIPLPKALAPLQPAKIMTRAFARNLVNTKHVKGQQPSNTILQRPNEQQKAAVAEAPKLQKPAVRRISNDFNKTEDSLYVSALEESDSVSDTACVSDKFEEIKRRSTLIKNELTKSDPAQAKNDEKLDETKAAAEIKPATLPAGVEDFDAATAKDPFQVGVYAMDIFNYLKEREREFPIDDYLPKQVNITKWMRSLLVDWMVEVQETFELNHETLYLAVKIVDHYLCKVVVNRDQLQLLGAAAFFIACKFDERSPPLVEDFLYICDGAYTHEQLIKMEMQTLKTIEFDLGIPLSYRFLRRYARCAKILMPTLTLARYILELSLMDYATIRFSDSKLAAAVLFMALRLHGEERAWTPTLVYYTGYQLHEFAELVPVLNAGLHRKYKGSIKTIKSKYSHQIFHEVAKVPLMSTEKLFEKTELSAESILKLTENQGGDSCQG